MYRKRYKNMLFPGMRVSIISGSNKGRSGEIFLVKGDKIFVRGINEYNRVKKDQKIRRNLFVHRSNLMVLLNGENVKIGHLNKHRKHGKNEQ